MGTRDEVIIDIPSLPVDAMSTCLPNARVVDALIPMVQRSAGPTALLREPRLEIAVNATGEVIARFIAGAR